MDPEEPLDGPLELVGHLPQVSLVVGGNVVDVARRRLVEAIAERDRGLVYDSGNVKVEEYLGRWLEDSVRGSVKVTTYAGHERVARLHVCPTLGKTRLAALTPAQVQTLSRQKLEEGLAPKSVTHVHTTLYRALKQAVRWGQETSRLRWTTELGLSAGIRYDGAQTRTLRSHNLPTRVPACCSTLQNWLRQADFLASCCLTFLRVAL